MSTWKTFWAQMGQALQGQPSDSRRKTVRLGCEELEPRLLLTGANASEVYAFTVVNELRANPELFADQLDAARRDQAGAFGYSRNDPVWDDLRRGIDRGSYKSNYADALELMRDTPNLNPFAWSERLHDISEDHNNWMQTHCYAHSNATTCNTMLPGFNTQGINGEPDILNSSVLGAGFTGAHGENIQYSAGNSMPNTTDDFSTTSDGFRQRRIFLGVLRWIGEWNNNSSQYPLGHLETLLSTSLDTMGHDENIYSAGLTNGNTSYLGTQTFARSAIGNGGGYISGVVYSDTNGNGYYDRGEGVNIHGDYVTVGGLGGGWDSSENN
ncbi:MAG: hypothetical protein N2C14_00695, partial [Planctomycetales bacterium]